MEWKSNVKKNISLWKKGIYKKIRLKMREKSQLREEDVKLSNNIYDFLDKTFYKDSNISEFERVTDKGRQIKRN